MFNQFFKKVKTIFGLGRNGKAETQVLRAPQHKKGLNSEVHSPNSESPKPRINRQPLAHGWKEKLRRKAAIAFESRRANRAA